MGGSHSNPNLKILLLGLDNAGKTTLLETLRGGTPHAEAPTRGYKIRKVQFANSELVVWDIGGQVSIRQQWSNYFNKVDGIIWVVDSADQIRLFEAGLEMTAVLRDDRLKGVPLLIFANKRDLATSRTGDDLVFDLNLQSIRNRAWRVHECSAINTSDEGVSLINEGVRWLVSEIK